MLIWTKRCISKGRRPYLRVFKGIFIMDWARDRVLSPSPEHQASTQAEWTRVDTYLQGMFSQVSPKPPDWDWGNLGLFLVLLLTSFKANDINLYPGLPIGKLQGYLWSLLFGAVGTVLRELAKEKKTWKVNCISLTVKTVSQIWVFIMLFYTYILSVILMITP